MNKKGDKIMNYNLKSLLFFMSVVSFSKNFTSATTESSRSLTIGQQYVFPAPSSPNNPFAQGTANIGIITTQKLVSLDNLMKEIDRGINQAFIEKRAAMQPFIEYTHFLIQGSQKSPDIQKALDGNKNLFLEKLKIIITREEEFLEPIVKEHLAVLVALHKLQEELESIPK